MTSPLPSQRIIKAYQLPALVSLRVELGTCRIPIGNVDLCLYASFCLPSAQRLWVPREENLILGIHGSELQYQQEDLHSKSFPPPVEKQFVSLYD